MNEALKYLLAGAIILALLYGVFYLAEHPEVGKRLFPENGTPAEDLNANGDSRPTSPPGGPDAESYSPPTSPPPATGRGTSLDLSGRELTAVPVGVFSRNELTILDLSHNMLDGALPAEVRHLKQLRTLDLSNNNFTGVPAEIGQLEKLEVLDLSNNPITGLPLELGNLQNLQRLDLSGTQYAAYDLEQIEEALPATTVIVR